MNRRGEEDIAAPTMILQEGGGGERIQDFMDVLGEEAELSKLRFADLVEAVAVYPYRFKTMGQWVLRPLAEPGQ